MGEQPSLELLHVTIRKNHADAVLNEITKALFHSGGKQKCLDIDLDIDKDSTANVANRLFGINSILNHLHSSSMQDYALRVTKCRQHVVDVAATRALKMFQQLNE